MKSHHYTNSAPGCIDNWTAGYINTTTAIDGVQFKFASGNIDSGTIDANRLNAASIAGLALDIGGTDASSWHVDADGNTHEQKARVFAIAGNAV